MFDNLYEDDNRYDRSKRIDAHIDEDFDEIDLDDFTAHGSPQLHEESYAYR